MKILIAPCERPLRNGKRNPREYPYWSDLISLLSKKHEICILNDHKSLKELKDFILQFDAIITIDSFFQHFCWYYGKKCYVIFGPSDPNIFGHKENINILESRNNLRPYQFDIWEHCEYNEKIFPAPQQINNYF